MDTPITEYAFAGDIPAARFARQIRMRWPLKVCELRGNLVRTDISQHNAAALAAELGVTYARDVPDGSN